jgi:hypothetical protein
MSLESTETHIGTVSCCLKQIRDFSMLSLIWITLLLKKMRRFFINVFPVIAKGVIGVPSLGDDGFCFFKSFIGENIKGLLRKLFTYLQ